MKKQKAVVFLPNKTIERVRYLLNAPCFDELSKEEMEQKGFQEDYDEFVYKAQFEDGSFIVYNLRSGMHNYWDDVYWSDGKTDTREDYSEIGVNYSLDDEEEYHVDNRIYIVVIKNLDDYNHFKKKCYEIYKLNWMLQHQITITDYTNALFDAYKENLEDGNIDGSTPADMDWKCIMDSFFEHGFYGEMYVCEEEFYDYEFMDREYMISILPLEIVEEYKDWMEAKKRGLL